MAAGPEPRKAATAENTEPPLKYKTWVLKVSVHCEGCKKKVKRILRSIDGVYTADVDLRQQKATVIGNVDADTLIKKLIKKTGKHAELWPEKADNNPKDKKKGKGKEKEKEKESDEESSDEEGDDGENEREVKVKNIVVKIQDPSPQHGGGCHGVVGGHEGGGVQVTEVRIDEVTAKKPATSPGGGQSPVTDKKVGGECEAGTGGSAGGGKKKKKKKKKKKAHTGNNTTGDEGEHSGHAPAGTVSPSLGHAHVQIQHPANRSPPRQNQVYEYPATTWYAPTVYAVSSSVAHPSTCYGASYYAPPYSNACVLLPPSDSDMDPYPPQPSGSFEIFSDENPNACSVM